MNATGTPRRYRRKHVLFLATVLVLGTGYLSYLTAIREFPFDVGSVMFRLRFGTRSVRSSAADDLLHPETGWTDVGLVLRALEEGLLESFESRTLRANAIVMLHWSDPSSRPSAWPPPEAAVPVLIDALGDPYGDVRAKAALVLGNLGDIARDAIPALIVALEDWSGNVVRAAAGALLRIRPEAKAAVPALRELRESEDKSLAGWATFALLELDTREYPLEAKVAAHIAVLERGDGRFQREAAEALGQIGPRAKEAVPVLLRFLRKGYHYPKPAIARALVRIRPEPDEVVPALIGNLRLTGVKEAVAEALESLDPNAKGVSDFMTGPLKNLGLSPEEFAEVLVKALKDPDPTVRSAATYYVRTLRPSDKEVIPELRRALSDPDEFVRRWAAEGLERVEGRESAGDTPAEKTRLRDSTP